MISLLTTERIEPAWGATRLLVLSAALLLCYGLFSVVYNLFLHPLHRVPGPKLNAISQVPCFRLYTSGHAHIKVLELHKKYGDVVRIAPNEVSFSSFNAWREIMGRRKGEPENGKDQMFVKYVSSSGSIIGAEGADHPRIRTIISPGFSAQAMMRQEPIIRQYVDLLIQRLRENCSGGNKALDMAQWFNWTTFDVIGDLAFGEPFDCLKNSSKHVWVEFIFSSLRLGALQVSSRRFPLIGDVLAWFLPRELLRRRAEHVGMSTAKVQKRLALGASRPDFMAAMAAEDGSAKNMTFKEIRSTSQTFIVAGSETTATALSAAVYYLTTHPRVLKTLEHEIRSTFESEDDIHFLSVQKLPYMLAVLNETLRIHPPVPSAFPRVSAGCTVSGHYMPPGTVLGIWQWPMYHNPQNFALPDDFVPERWLGDERFANDQTECFHPFSFGARDCIGRNLAYTEMRLILARVIWNFDLKLDEKCRNWVQESETYMLWLKGSVNVHLTPVSRS